MSTLTPNPDPELAARLALVADSGVYHRFDCRRYEWLAQLLRESGHTHAAELCLSWANEHRALAHRGAA